MHVVQFLKSDHSAPSGGRSNFSKNTDFCTSDFHLCGRRFYKNCRAEFSETWHNNYLEDVADARCLILKISSFSALWWKIELERKIQIAALMTFIYVDEGFAKTVGQNSIRLGTTIVKKMLLMHIVQVFKSNHSTPTGGRWNCCKNTDFCTSDFHLCG